jgi:hypothetical protein
MNVEATLAFPPVTKLCSDCARIAFRQLLAPKDGPSHENTHLRSRLLYEFQTKPNCPFCRLVTKTIATKYPGLNPNQTFHLRGERLGQTYDPLAHDLSFHNGWGTSYHQIRLSVHPDGFEDDDRNPESKPELRKRCINEVIFREMSDRSDRDEDMMKSRGIMKDQIDPNVIHRWIKLCDELHKPAKHQPLDINSDLFVIDVQNEKLIQLPGNDRYAALSYVWGPPSVPQLMWTKHTEARLFKDRGLSINSKDLPKTIRDAMTLCQMLGVQFLWVDALCIRQDDDLNKLKVIQEMDLVYQKALLTIVSASGRDSWAGLPGVQPGSRPLGHIEIVDGLPLVNAPHGYGDIVLNTAWYDRAWTFQEYVLSRKLLIFTNEQLFFTCDHFIFLETLILECQPDRPVDFRGGPDDWRIEFKSTEEDLRRNLPFVAKEMCRRKLTYENDLMNACNGIYGWLGRVYDTGFWMGVPTGFFDAGILFQGTKSCERRTIFPSWSWCGWVPRKSTRFPTLTLEMATAVVEVSWMRVFQLPDGTTQFNLIDNDKSWHCPTDHIDIDALPQQTPIEKEPVGARDRMLTNPGGEWFNTVMLYGSSRDPLSDSSINKVARLRAQWKPQVLPSLPSQLPCDLSTTEVSQLLVFQTSCVFLEVKLLKPARLMMSEPSDFIHRGRLPKEGRNPIEPDWSDFLKPEYEQALLQDSDWEYELRLLWPEPRPKVLELAVVGRRSFLHSTVCPLETMVIKTDERGISTRVERGPRLPDEVWVTMEPFWRTVFMV